MGKTAKLDGWQPQGMPNKELCERLRQYVKEAIFARWNTLNKPSTLQQIYISVHHRIEKERRIGWWPKEWGTPGKRTVDRRVNECADPDFYPRTRVAKIVAVTAGTYRPNMRLYETSDEDEDHLGPWAV